MQLYIATIFDDVRNTTLERNSSSFISEEIVDDPVHANTIRRTVYPLIAIGLFGGFYVYKIVKRQTYQFTHFLPFHIIMHLQIISTFISLLATIFSPIGTWFFYPLISHYIWFLSQHFLVLASATFQMFFALFGLKIDEKKSFFGIGIPICLVMKIAAYFGYGVLEIHHFKIEFDILDSIFIIISLLIFIGFYIKRHFGYLEISQKLVCVILNGFITIPCVLITKIFIIFHKVSGKPFESIFKTVEFSYYSFFFPFLWIIAVYISYSAPVQKFIQKNDVDFVEDVPEIQMTPVNVESRLRRASIETTVSYLSIAEITLDV